MSGAERTAACKTELERQIKAAQVGCRGSARAARAGTGTVRGYATAM
jgi:hypothetical protein